MEILNLLLLIATGGFAGWAATRLFKTDMQNSIYTYVIIGVIGAVIGKLVIEFVGFEVTGDGVVVDFIVALIGAVILVGTSKLVAGKLSR